MYTTIAENWVHLRNLKINNPAETSFKHNIKFSSIRCLHESLPHVESRSDLPSDAMGCALSNNRWTSEWNLYVKPHKLTCAYFHIWKKNTLSHINTSVPQFPYDAPSLLIMEHKSVIIATNIQILQLTNIGSLLNIRKGECQIYAH